MKTVLVTGAYGFIGKNLCAALEQNKDLTVLRFDKENNENDLDKFLGQADFVFHLAGVNRPKTEAEFDKGNRGLTEQIIQILESKKKKTPLLITSSIQAELNNAYGKSKKDAEEAVLTWAKRTSNKAYVYRLPNVFGKWSRPNYNSAVATFCYNIARDMEITINDPASKLTLVYIDDVVAEFLLALNGHKEIPKDGFCRIPREFETTVGQLADTILGFKNSRDNLTVTNFENTFEKFLYATYTSYLPTDEFAYSLKMMTDERGWLSEFIKSQQFGQIFVSRTKPGITRGNHWHHTKVEKFLVLSGNAEVRFRGIGDTKPLSYKVSGDKLEVIDIPAGYTHSIKNIGKSDLLTLFWASEIFDPAAADTYYEEV